MKKKIQKVINRFRTGLTGFAFPGKGYNFFSPYLLMTFIFHFHVIYNLESVPHFIIHPYSGKYKKSREFEQVIKELRVEIPFALAKMENKLGCKASKNFRCQLTFKDSIEGSRTSGRIRALRTTSRDDLGYLHNITINISYIFQGVASIKEEILHELTHALMLEDLGASIYLKIPNWFREGIALKIANQGEKRFQEILLNLSTGPVNVFNGLERTVLQPHFFMDYAEDFQAIKWIEKKWGSNIIKKLISELKSGTEFGYIFPMVLGISFDNLNKKFKKHFFNLLPFYYQPEYFKSKVRDIYKLFSIGKYKAVTILGDGLFKRKVPAQHKKMLAYIMGKSHYNTGNFEKSLFYLDSLSGYKGPLRKEVRVMVTRCFLKLGILSEALVQADRFLREDELNSPYRQEVVELKKKIKDKIAAQLPF
ncbi:hypothetical protein ACFL35_06745 [Candidatus Riflebacteria bacterium]